MDNVVFIIDSDLTIRKMIQAHLEKEGLAVDSFDSGGKRNTASQLTYADIALCQNKITTYCNGKELRLTGTEFKLLAYMLENQEKAVAGSELLTQIWGDGTSVNIRAVDDIVKRLRKKLGDALSRVCIDTVWGHGFRLGAK